MSSLGCASMRANCPSRKFPGLLGNQMDIFQECEALTYVTTSGAKSTRMEFAKTPGELGECEVAAFWKPIQNV